MQSSGVWTLKATFQEQNEIALREKAPLKPLADGYIIRLPYTAP